MHPTYAEYQRWRETTPSPQAWTVKYYKGLGTSTAQEAREYFSLLTRHMSSFRYDGPADDRAFHLAFDKDRADERKTWMLDFRYGRSPSSQRSCWLGPTPYNVARLFFGSGEHGVLGKAPAAGSSSAPVAAAGAAGGATAFSTFFDTDFIKFSVADTVRSIPSVVDGLKPSQRKVLFACLKRNLRSEMKVAQLSGMFVPHERWGHSPVITVHTYAPLFFTPSCCGRCRLRGASECVPPRRGQLECHDRQHGAGLCRVQQRPSAGAQRPVWHALAKRSAPLRALAACCRLQHSLTRNRNGCTRTNTGKDAASARYIFTRLSPMAFALFPRTDEALLEYAEEDGQVRAALHHKVHIPARLHPSQTPHSGQPSQCPQAGPV